LSLLSLSAALEWEAEREAFWFDDRPFTLEIGCRFIPIELIEALSSEIFIISSAGEILSIDLEFELLRFMVTCDPTSFFSFLAFFEDFLEEELSF
jgi:hypothetical protein